MSQCFYHRAISLRQLSFLYMMQIHDLLVTANEGEASRFHLGRQHQHSAVIYSGALLFSSRVLRPSLVMLCSHKSGRCEVELYHASHLWYPLFYTSRIASSALQH